MDVSRSGFYNYFNEKSVQKRAVKDDSDEVVKNIILKAYYFRGRKKGARQIKMTLQNQYQINTFPAIPCLKSRCSLFGHVRCSLVAFAIRR